MGMTELTLSGLVTIGGVAVLVAIVVQALKRALPSGAVPPVALVVGALVGLLASWALGRTAPAELGQAVLTGVVGGAVAVHLYELQKPIGILPQKRSPEAGA